MPNTIEKGLDFTLGVAVLTAEALDQVINGLVEKGKVARENAPAVFDAVMERGRPTREQFVRTVREEVLPQLKLGGPASRDEIRALEERVTTLETQVNAASTTPSAVETPPVEAETPEVADGVEVSQAEAEVGGAVAVDTDATSSGDAAEPAEAPEILTEAAAHDDTPGTEIQEVVENERTGDASA